VRGKTGERDVVLRSVAAKRLDKYLAKRRSDDPKGFLFSKLDGTKIVSLIGQLDAALVETRIERNSFGEKHSVYSLHCDVSMP